jgi:hypothetical protein
VTLVEPEHWLFEAGAWDDVERFIGRRLPRDYKATIGDGLACLFDEELVIASPFDPNPNLNLIQLAARNNFVIAYHRQYDPTGYPVALHPEAGGLLGWGADGGGGIYYWDTADPDPDDWTIAIAGRPVFDPDVQRHELGLTAYLDALARGDIKAAALGDWPAPNARIERRRP